MKVWLIGIVGLALAFGVAVGVAAILLAESGTGSLSIEGPAEVPADDPEPTATPYEKRLTGTEAAATVQTRSNDTWYTAWYNCNNGVSPSGPGPGPICDEDTKTYLFITEDCRAVEFNDHTHEWIVQCDDWVENTLTGQRRNQGVLTYRVSDETSDYYEVGVGN